MRQPFIIERGLHERDNHGCRSCGRDRACGRAHRRQRAEVAARPVSLRHPADVHCLRHGARADRPVGRADGPALVQRVLEPARLRHADGASPGHGLRARARAVRAPGPRADRGPAENRDARGRARHRAVAHLRLDQLGLRAGRRRHHGGRGRKARPRQGHCRALPGAVHRGVCGPRGELALGTVGLGAAAERHQGPRVREADRHRADGGHHLLGLCDLAVRPQPDLRAADDVPDRAQGGGALPRHRALAARGRERRRAATSPTA